jgi:transcriptional regulator with XRE-family HTH domain
VRLNGAEIRRRCRERGQTLTELLRSAGVSRTAYYALERRPRVIPRTVESVAEALGVPASMILEETDAVERRAH